MINLQTSALVIMVKFFLSRTGSRYPRDVLQRSPLNTVRSKIPKPSWQNPLISSVSLYPASFPALIKARESGSLGMLLCTFNGPDLPRKSSPPSL